MRHVRGSIDKVVHLRMILLVIFTCFSSVIIVPVGFTEALTAAALNMTQLTFVAPGEFEVMTFPLQMCADMWPIVKAQQDEHRRAVVSAWLDLRAVVCKYLIARNAIQPVDRDTVAKTARAAAEAFFVAHGDPPTYLHFGKSGVHGLVMLRPAIEGMKVPKHGGTMGRVSWPVE